MLHVPWGFQQYTPGRGLHSRKSTTSKLTGLVLSEDASNSAERPEIFVVFSY